MKIDNNNFNYPLKVYGLVNKNSQRLKLSSSGGAFSVLAKAVLDDNGVVFGSTLCDDGSCNHISISKMEDLHKVQGSKYTKSNLKNTFRECLDYLNMKKRVLFTGTPCQIYYLNCYLQKNINKHSILENLITTDLICHGSPSNSFFKLYINWLSKKLNTDDGIHNFTFRAKDSKWGTFYCSYNYYHEGKYFEIIENYMDNPYYESFFNNKMLTEKCYTCHFSQEKRCSDFTIGDYWGIENYHKEFYDKFKKNGISVLLINSEKALSYFYNNCEESCYLCESSLKKAKSNNPRINSSNTWIYEDGIKYKELRKKVYKNLGKGRTDRVFSNILRPHDSKYDKLNNTSNGKILKVGISFSHILLPKKLRKIIWQKLNI